MKKELKTTDVIDFGQHRGKTIAQVIKEQPEYVRWMWYKLGYEFTPNVWRALNDTQRTNTG